MRSWSMRDRVTRSLLAFLVNFAVFLVRGMVGAFVCDWEQKGCW
jgi:hypothetical protein